MAKKTNSKKTTPPPVTEVAPVNVDRKRQVRLGFGIFFMLSGVYICLSIVSYFFTWTIDQDAIIAKTGSWIFLRNDTHPIANMGGRLGAVLSHILVYKGAGIASLTIGLVVTAIGIHLIYGKKAVPLLRYLRWLSILLLLVAPITTYLIPVSSFPYGGALGNIAIEYLSGTPPEYNNGILGYVGTGLVLLSTVLFFVFVIFALDIRPFLKRMRAHARNMAASMKPEPVFNEPATGSETESSTEAGTEPVILPADTYANQLNHGSDGTTPVINDTRTNKEWNMGLVEKKTQPNPDLPGGDKDQEDESDEEDEEFRKFREEREAGATKSNQPDDLEFSYVVKQVDEPAVKHGHHISIADNEPFAPEESLRSYKYPTLDLLEDRVQEAISLNKEELERNKDQIINTLKSFGIEIKTITATVGPTVTLYEVVPAEGVRISKIRNLEDDIALNLAALGIRIIAPIPGKGTIGIEVPNANKQIVSMRAMLSSEKFVNNKMSLPIALGKKIDNENYIVDLTTMPHLLMAGATGQGKSVGINAILVSLLYKKHPSQLKFVLIDPKKVELSVYRKIEKHFLAKLPNESEPIITDTKKAIYTLKALEETLACEKSACHLQSR